MRVHGGKKPATRWNKRKHDLAFCPSHISPPGSFTANSFRIASLKSPLLYNVPRQRKPLQGIRSLVNATASVSESVHNGVNWVTQNKGKVSNLIDFSKLDKRSRRGIHISEDTDTVLKGTELAEFPEGTFLTPTVARSLLEKEASWAEIEDLNLGDEALFAVCLLVERAKGEGSMYAGLLETLPSVNELDSPDFWKDEELELLRGSSVYEKSIGVREAIEEEWAGLNTRLFENNRDRFNEEDFSLDVYKWAIGMVDSRTVSAGRGEARVLAPVLHNAMPPRGRNNATGRVEMSGGVFFSKKRIVLKAQSDVAAGEEVSISTGEGCFNSDYLVERGTVVEGGASKFEVRLEVSGLDRFYDDKVDIIERGGLGKRTSFELTEGTESGKWEAGADMERFLRLVCLSGADVFLLEGVFRGDVWETMGMAVSAENERAMCEVMIGACEDALEEFDKGWERMKETKGGDEKMSERRREMSKTIVEGEKEIVLSVVKTYKARLGSLDAIEYYAERRLKMLDLLRPVDESEIVDSESGARIGRAFDENLY